MSGPRRLPILTPETAIFGIREIGTTDLVAAGARRSGAATQELLLGAPIRDVDHIQANFHALRFAELECAGYTRVPLGQRRCLQLPFPSILVASKSEPG